MHATPRFTRWLPLAALALLALAGASAAEAHQCVDVEIIEAPHRAEAGQVIRARSAITNCGTPARGFLVTWTLVSEDGDREILRRAVAKVRPGHTIRGTVRLMIPADTEPGNYRLVLSGKAPNGFVDRESSRLQVLEPTE